MSLSLSPVLLRVLPVIVLPHILPHTPSSFSLLLLQGLADSFRRDPAEYSGSLGPADCDSGWLSGLGLSLEKEGGTGRLGDEDTQ